MMLHPGEWSKLIVKMLKANELPDIAEWESMSYQEKESLLYTWKENRIEV